jgi:hypothetical protein
MERRGRGTESGPMKLLSHFFLSTIWRDKE